MSQQPGAREDFQGNIILLEELIEMEDKIKVVIADDIRETRQNIRALLSFDERIEVIGEAENGEDAIFLAREAHPDIILMDVNMPVKNGIKATEEISLESPETSVIVISVQSEQEYMRKAMAAGARDYIAKPFSDEDLINTIIRTYNMEERRRQKTTEIKADEVIDSKVITVFSTKGGVGKTTIASNLAVTIARQTKKRVALLDLDLFFGNVAIHLNVSSKANISELVKVIGSLDVDLVEDFLVSHFSGVRVLAAPNKPEYAEYITPQHIEKILAVLRKKYHYIIIDTAQSFGENTLAVLDASEKILFVSTMDLPAIKNINTGLELMKTLKYPDSKIHIVLNRVSEQFGVKYSDFENAVKHKIWAAIPEDNTTVINSVNKGLPFVMTRSVTQVSKKVYEMGTKLTASQNQALNEKRFLQRILGF